MTAAPSGFLEELDRAGFAVLRGVFIGGEVDAILSALSAALARAARAEPALVGPAGGVYAARNVLSMAGGWRRVAVALAAAPP